MPTPWRHAFDPLHPEVEPAQKTVIERNEDKRRAESEARKIDPHSLFPPAIQPRHDVQRDAYERMKATKAGDWFAITHSQRELAEQDERMRMTARAEQWADLSRREAVREIDKILTKPRRPPLFIRLLTWLQIAIVVVGISAALLYASSWLPW